MLFQRHWEKLLDYFGIKDDSKFMGRWKDCKNSQTLALLTPIGLPFLVPHIAKSFFPDIFGKGGVVSSVFGKNGTAWGGIWRVNYRVGTKVRSTGELESNVPKIWRPHKDAGLRNQE